MSDVEFKGLQCSSCGSRRFVSVSYDEGYTRRAQCVPCGRVHQTWHAPGWRSNRARADEQEATPCPQGWHDVSECGPHDEDPS